MGLSLFKEDLMNAYRDAIEDRTIRRRSEKADMDAKGSNSVTNASAGDLVPVQAEESGLQALGELDAPR